MNAPGFELITDPRPDRVQLRAAGRKRQQRDVRRDGQIGRAVPSGLVEQDNGMSAGRDMEGDLFEVHAYRLAVALGHDDAGGFSFRRADGAKDPCRGAALILWSRRTGAAPGPTAGKLGLLANPRLVLPPQLYRRAGREFPADSCQAGNEALLKSSMSSGF